MLIKMILFLHDFIALQLIEEINQQKKQHFSNIIGLDFSPYIIKKPEILLFN